jgi:hypothetical protein
MPVNQELDSNLTQKIPGTQTGHHPQILQTI